VNTFSVKQVWRCTQGCNHVFKVGVQFLGLGYCTEQTTDGIPSFVHSSCYVTVITLCIKKVGVVRPIFFLGGEEGEGGRSGLPPPEPPSGCALGSTCIHLFVDLFEELEFILERLSSVLGVDMQQCLVVQVLDTTRADINQSINQSINQIYFSVAGNNNTQYKSIHIY